MDIDLNIKKGFNWYQDAGIYVKGYLFDKDGRFYEKEDLINYFNNLISEEDFNIRLCKANGCFSVVVKQEGKIFASVDRIRTFPIFYNSSQLSDDSMVLAKTNLFLKDKLSLNEFAYTGFVTGVNTVYKNVYQLEAGSYLIYEGDKVSIRKYSDYLTEDFNSSPYDQLVVDFENIISDTFDRLLQSIKGRTPVIPLSGGYDSRIILTLLKKNNVENVICFTYGDRSDEEVIISEKVAKELGYKWYFIEYSTSLFEPQYRASTEFLNYLDFSFNGNSLPHLQDFFAVKDLKDNDLLPDDSVFIPGHSGDFLGGSHFPDISSQSKIKLSQYLINKFYLLRPFFGEKRIIKKIQSDYNDKFKSNFVIENWNLKERQAKFIINSVRVYEYFGFEHRLPLWDAEFISFFKKLPSEYKKNSFLYNQVLRNEFTKFNIDFVPVNKKKIKRKSIKNKLPIFLTYILRSMLKFKRNKKQLTVFHRLFSDFIYEQRIMHYNFNSILARWIISKTIK